MISPRQISLFTEEQLTFLLEDSHASHIQPLESALEKKTHAIYGPKCLEQFEKFNRHGSWAKTFSALLIGMEDWSSKRCKLIWRLRGTKYKRLFFLLQVSELHTKDNEFGSWLLKTPTKMDGEVTSGKKYPKSGNSGTLAQEIMSNYKPTMKKLGMLPTPNAFDWNTAQKVEKYEKRKKMQAEKGVNLHYSLRQMAMDVNPNGTTSQLSPQFVLEMMGFPIDWTELPFLNGEKNLLKLEETQSFPK